MKETLTYENYRELRLKAGFTSDYAVSRETGIMPYVFSRWKNKGNTPHYLRLRKIADAIGATVDQIYDGGGLWD